jgi:sugar phosphate isomerase/epimerase
MKVFILLLGGLFARSLFAQPSIGIVAPIRMDSLVSISGYDVLVESVSNLVSPKTISDAQFEANLKTLSNLKTPVYALNIFIPGDMKLVGPLVNEKALLEYVEIVFMRCKKAGIKLIVWGSGGARRIPEGFSPAMAKLQFIELAKKVAQVAERYEVVLALENLNRTETNFINTVNEAFEIVTLVDHPNMRLCADIYHMLKENEPPGILLTAREVLVHCDLAEKENRNPPGVNGEDFAGYLKSLKQIR